MSATPQWDTGLCDCCAEPGGCMLCCVTYMCSCFVSGKIGETVGQQGGYWGNCIAAFVPILGCFCLCDNAIKTQKKYKNLDIEQYHPCIRSYCPCSAACFVCQVRRQQLIGGSEPSYFPASEQASAALLSGNKKPAYASCA